jgi:GntR family transcriptional repressor for pyruvate dehydrogenase complex
MQTVRLAAGKATDVDIAELRQASERVDLAKDVIRKTRADVAFHSRLARASGNPVIETMFFSIIELVFEHILRSNAEPAIVDEGNPFHHRVVDAIARHDPDAAEAAIKSHLDVSLRRYGSDLDAPVEQLFQRELDRMQVPEALRSNLLVADEEIVTEDRS